AAQPAHLPLAQGGDIHSRQRDLRTGLDGSAPGQKPHDRARCHGLARAAYAHERDGFSLVELEGNVAHGVDHTALDLEVDSDVPCVKDQLPTVLAEIVPFRWGEGVAFRHSRPFQYGSTASRRPSPSALKAKTVISTNTTGERIQG